jgi:hypothetical protein
MGQSIPHHLRRKLVRRAVLSAAHFCEPRDGDRACRDRAAETNGAQAVPFRHADRLAGAGIRPVAVAGLRHYRKLVVRQTFIGAGADRLPLLLRRAGETIRRRPEYAQPYFLSLVQRSSGAGADGGGDTGYGEAVLRNC